MVEGHLERDYLRRRVSPSSGWVERWTHLTPKGSDMRWENCPACWTLITSSGDSFVCALPPVPVTVIVHEDGTAVIAFRLERGPQVVMTGRRWEIDHHFHLQSDSPDFYGTFVVDIDAEGSYASGVLTAQSLPDPHVWRAKLELYLRPGQRAQ